MKALTFCLILLFTHSVSHAWIANEPEAKLYNFKFRLKDNTFEYSQKAGSYEEAFDKAAQACYKYYKNGKKLSEDRGLDIIDICANPRSS